MQYLGNTASVPLGNGKWSPFLPIREAERLVHNLDVERFLNVLRAGKTIIGFHSDAAAIYDAQQLFKKEQIIID